MKFRRMRSEEDAIMFQVSSFVEVFRRHFRCKGGIDGLLGFQADFLFFEGGIRRY
jgi:hypothetical protein